MTTMTREQKLAQCFIVGSDEPDLLSAMTPFVAAGVGLGGVLLFRQHTQPFETAEACRDWITQLRQAANLSWVSVDQEGGQVERFPHWFFPTGVQAQLLGKQPDTDLTHDIATTTAERLAWLGVNLNFAPTVDINTEPRNPIIGARSYGATAETVIAHSKRVIDAHVTSGVLPTIKHFPGHGTSLLDSHHALPVFSGWKSHELDPYKSLLTHSVRQPAVMVAHGLYPELFKELGADPKLPASLNPSLIQTLLRQQLGFDGLVLTDDLMMGAVHPESGQGFDPIEVGFWAWQAGVDLLVYRRAQPEAWAVYQALLEALKQGKLDEADLEARWTRIQRAKAALPALATNRTMDTQASTVASISLNWAQQAVANQPALPKPLTPESEVFVVYPDSATMVHYALDADVPERDGLASPSLVESLYQVDIVPMAYPLQAPNTPSDPELLESLVELPFDVVDDVETIVFMAVNAVLSPLQQDLFYTLKRQYPDAPIQLISVGADSDASVLRGAQHHLCLPSYRPASLTVLSQWLTGTLPAQTAMQPSLIQDQESH